MTNILNVIRFNVRDLGDPVKRKRVLTFLKKERAAPNPNPNPREIGEDRSTSQALQVTVGSTYP